MAELYRKTSLEKLSNPEQLDRAITVTSPMSWLALIGVALIIVATLIWSVVGSLPTVQTVNGLVVSPQSVGAYCSEKSGTVSRLLKSPGDSVKEEEGLAVVKTGDGSEYTVKASDNGTLTDYVVEVGAKVSAGMEIARFTPKTEQEQLVACYVPITIAQQLKEDMKVLLYLSSADSQTYGHMEGWIDSIGEYAANTSNMWYVVGADNLMADQFLSQGPVVLVTCHIKTDDTAKSGYYWSSENGKQLTVSNGTFVTAKIITDESAPITKLFNGLKEKWEG